ncbi:hypothetical protein FEM48_Zijuj04G0037500 [Ziziphus jujuba var. spinosa]|uniref:AAA+ ATPase domain-containing protein n=1 Tax=Ziziphus jujuba var. spinosa TaxID=714518 RepID=A0A978VHM1_ZIZJJ|nr:hypothetical protein FEM48_Zijuj04G0037500 [Ziziphus jujuba var. spinosa]
MHPFIQINFYEYNDDYRYRRSQVYVTIQTYLSASPFSNRAKRLKAHETKDCRTFILSMDDNQEIIEEFQGVKEGKAIALRNRQLKLYTNNGAERSTSSWSHVAFQHPATFETLAMDPRKEEEIINDLDKFIQGKEYYNRIGKTWKRGYLLYGPLGTGKSTMISTMANYLKYDIYDLELTAVKDNVDLRKLLIDTSNKSIIVIEDIDCSLDLTAQRKEKAKKEDKISSKKEQEEEKKKSMVTLSGLLNCIDGIWSSCGGERLVVFTTNYVDKLDPALIRRGRMDKHIEFSYCCFEAFKVLAKNYLEISSHPYAETCLNNLTQALEMVKEETRKKAEEKEAKLKAEEEEKLKADKEENEENESENLIKKMWNAMAQYQHT